MLGPWIRLAGALVAIAACGIGLPSSAQTLTYDAQGRVAVATYLDGTKIQYCYDQAGNRVLYTVTASTVGSCPQPSPPVSHNVAVTVPKNTYGNTVTPSLTGGTPTSVGVSAAASHGTAVAIGTTLNYTPAAGYSGTDSFQYTANNGGGTSTPSSVSVTVSP